MDLTVAPPLEDELGDVLEKAARHAALTYEAVAKAANVELSRIHDAIDYRPDLKPAELSRLAHVLNLNEVGLAALAQNAYPRPEIGALPFCLFPCACRSASAWRTPTSSRPAATPASCSTPARADRS
ncbi:hypothetical protein [Oleiharenicola sp. Vm1]|uniref:hypothetical protein n=1 Tax=Oleiharenicola sp. Vm1 TaxID=3398393 RepID=UPI0039F5405E